MPTYNAPTRDTRFVINEMLDLASYGTLPGFEHATPDMIDTVVNEAGKFCSEVLAPINQSGDEEGCTRHEDGSVTTPRGFKEAYDAYVEGGWGTWQAWSPCTVSCNGGQHERKRDCDRPEPKGGGTCPAGDYGDTEVARCNGQECAYRKKT